jgi:hypothetical protein
MNTALLSEIDRFLRESGMGEFRFGLASVKNGRLVSRLRSGGRVWPETEAQVRAFIIANSHRSQSCRRKGTNPHRSEAVA